ncbi:MAG: hypothetical protein D6706_20905 [Chloroflexi bacterium]|nr:MAG: hypothetical protein D6706_20905 [Chloroflexota bacterium]
MIARWKIGLYAFMLLALLLGIASEIVQAHGGGDLIVSKASAGPYWVSVWVSPAEPIAGQEVHVSVAVTTAVSEQPILDAKVQLQVHHPETNNPLLTRQVTNTESTNKLLYETDFILDEAATYPLTLQISATDGEGTITFPLIVQPPDIFNSFLLTILGFSLFVLYAAYRTWKITRDT